MWLRNNSNKKWEDYNCGNNVVVTIEPLSDFEIDDVAGMLLLKNLGHENWLTMISAPEIKKEKKEEIKKETKKKSK